MEDLKDKKKEFQELLKKSLTNNNELFTDIQKQIKETPLKEGFSSLITSNKNKTPEEKLKNPRSENFTRTK